MKAEYDLKSEKKWAEFSEIMLKMKDEFGKAQLNAAKMREKIV